MFGRGRARADQRMLHNILCRHPMPEMYIRAVEFHTASLTVEGLAIRVVEDTVGTLWYDEEGGRQRKSALTATMQGWCWFERSLLKGAPHSVTVPCDRCGPPLLHLCRALPRTLGVVVVACCHRPKDFPLDTLTDYTGIPLLPTVLYVFGTFGFSIGHAVTKLLLLCNQIVKKDQLENDESLAGEVTDC